MARKKAYEVMICCSVMEKIEVWAENEQEAKNIVEGGDYDKSDIVSHKTDDFQIVDCNLCK